MSEQKTAMQYLIHDLEQFKTFPMVNQPTIEAAIEFAKLRLEQEKNQLQHAHSMGFSDAYGFPLKRTFEEYYNDVYMSDIKQIEK